MDKQTTISHHNAITTARYEYTETQLNIFFFLLAQLRPDNKDGVYTLSLKEMSSLTGKEYLPAHIKDSTELMGSRPFYIENETEWIQLWIFQKVRYIKGSGQIEIKLSEDIRPYLFDLKNNFTKFQLYSALRLTSKFAKRIYTLCSQWKSNGVTKRYDLQEFKTILGLYDPKTGEEKFKSVNLFKKLVLDEAVKQINQHTDLRINYQLKKEGRAFKWLTFSVQIQEENVKLPASLTKESKSTTSKKPSVVTISLPSGSISLEQLAEAANARGCMYNGTDLSKVYRSMVAWGASAEALQLVFSNDEYIGRYLKWARPFITNQIAPEFGVSEFLAMLEV